jgi:hypothetical protein
MCRMNADRRRELGQCTFTPISRTQLPVLSKCYDMQQHLVKRPAVVIEIFLVSLSASRQIRLQ